MCFSANASFIASGILLLVGASTLKKIKSSSEIPFALIAIFFAMQQFAEGLLWLSLNGNKIVPINLAQYFSNIFLFFALGLWPVWIPFSVLLIEKNEKRKKIISLILLLGICVSVYSLYWFIVNGATAQIVSNHIFYDLNIPKTTIDFVFYIIAVSAPFLISTQKWLKLFGVLLLASLAISYIFYLKTLTSVWCFFAAILSFFVFLIIRKNK